MTTSAGPPRHPDRSSQGLEPPPLPPPLAWPAIAEPQASAAEAGQIPRLSRRSVLPEASPGRLVLPDRTSVFVTLLDIGRGGCCVMRKGELDLLPEQGVRIEIWRDDIQTKDSLAATVRWLSRDARGHARAGLRFLDTSIKTQRLIEGYLVRSRASQPF